MGLSDPGRPIASFMFLGPTGVGKTELAKVRRSRTSTTAGAEVSARLLLVPMFGVSSRAYRRPGSVLKGCVH